MRKCSKCKKEKDFVEFTKDKYTKDNLKSTCKLCVKQYQQENKKKISIQQKQYYLNNKEKISIQKKQYRENNKEKYSEYQNRYNLENRYKRNCYSKKWYEENKEECIEKQKKYQKKNRKKINNRIKQKRKTDPLFNLMCSIRSLVCRSMKNQGYTKRSKTFKILGCSYEEFKLHIERQFKDGMSWENAGKWHYDHIYPVSLAKDEEELIKLNHYANLQPLWAEDNLKKSNKVI